MYQLQLPYTDPVLPQNTQPIQPIRQFQEQPSTPQLVDGEVGGVIIFPDKTRGIIFYKEGGKGLAVSMHEAEMCWLTASRKGVDIALIPNIEEDRTFEAGLGETYTQAILNQVIPGLAPAAEWCARQGSGWYLPSAGELIYLFRANDESRGYLISKGLKREGGQKFDGRWYWSSSEYKAKEAINVSTSGSIATEDKDEAQKVRAVRAFTY